MNVRLSRSPDIARIAKTSGHDFIFIDTQHSIFNLEFISNIAQVALQCDIAAVVRVKSINDPDVSLLLDCGVTGIVYPDINNSSEAQRAVEICRFAPLGKRSVSGGYPHFNFRPLSSPQTIAELQDVCLLVCMIETREGLDNIEKICAVPGIDVIHFGTYDFAASIGKAGQLDDAEVIAAQSKVMEVAHKHGKYSGCAGGRNIQRQIENIQNGAQFLITQTDFGFLMSAAHEWTDGVRNTRATGHEKTSSPDSPVL
ncbi:HpcH/HpaI aldolase family protein [Achromobacter spanius]|uniref:HpcH/HpaI aldolase family protein n=1 Tax=Achromobacter spanius TaxID=217203 RepID=UPI001E49AE37|nr:aldolase/citrate lyase family protein [Achromobacter spanius]